MLNSLLNGIGGFGRLAGGVFGDRFGLVNLTKFCAGAIAVTALFIWMFSKTLPGLLVYVICSGLLGSGFISLLVPAVAEQFGTDSLTILVGITYGAVGIGALFGTPIAATILSSLGGDVVYVGGGGGGGGSAPPDGGYGWVVVGVCFLSNFSIFGIMLSWGIFQQLYKDEVFPNGGQGVATAISWIGTLMFGIMHIGGGVFSLVAVRVGFRKMILIGSFLAAGALIGASFATKHWHLYLTQGILFGLGAAVTNPCIRVAPTQWFVTRRGTASGIAFSGASIGGLVFSLLTEKLNASIGHQWCLRVLGIIVWCSMVTCTLLIRQFPPNGAKPVNVSTKDVQRTMRQPAFLILLAGVLLTSFGYFSNLHLLPSYAVDHNLTQSQGALLNSFLNGGSFFGRFGGGIIGDRVGLVNLTIFCTAASALTTLFIWMFAKSSFSFLVVYAISFGLLGGGFISLLAPVVAEQFGTTDSLMILIGITYGVNGLGALLGTPIATTIMSSLEGNMVHGGGGNSIERGYGGAIGFIGGTMAVATLVLFFLKLKVGGKPRSVA
ncbi:hypothetical protein BGX29_005442 [Mortierella sp. GBA35]|nr:hypothetical protein BGX29_005442 [Mortierella sp. GBA35]